MAYVHGNLAERLNHAEVEVEQSPRREESTRARLRVVEGSRTRTQSEPCLSPLAVHVLKVAAVVVACFVVVCVVRIALIAGTYSVLVESRELSTQLEEARSLGSELEVQQSVYGNADRVRSIATDVYGMVPATQQATLDVTAPQAEAQASTEQTPSTDTAEDPASQGAAE